MIEGLSHVTFVVKSLDQTERLFLEIFSAEKVYDSGDKTFSISKERFFIIGGLWIVIMEGEALPSPTYNHVAFKISETGYEPYLKKIQAFGLKVREGRSRVQGEGRSIYFYDYDNHMFELHTGTLEERLARYKNEL